jgi:hypothetical protein
MNKFLFLFIKLTNTTLLVVVVNFLQPPPDSESAISSKFCRNTALQFIEGQQSPYHKPSASLLSDQPSILKTGSNPRSGAISKSRLPTLLPNNIPKPSTSDIPELSNSVTASFVWRIQDANMDPGSQQAELRKFPNHCFSAHNAFLTPSVRY